MLILQLIAADLSAAVVRNARAGLSVAAAQTMAAHNHGTTVRTVRKSEAQILCVHVDMHTQDFAPLISSKL